MNLPSHPLFDMLPSNVRELLSEGDQDSRFRKKQPLKEQGQSIDPDELISNAFEGGRKSAWGKPGAYEVP